MFTFFNFRSSIISNRVSISTLLIPVVGSSRRRMLAFIDSAFIISTILFCPRPRSPTKVLGSISIPKEDRYSAALRMSSFFLKVPKKDVIGS